jgi:hypothetical protein
MKPAPGIRRHGPGWQARLRRRRRALRAAVPPLATPVSAIQAWQKDERYRLTVQQRTYNPLAHVERGTFAADAKRYLVAVAAMPDLKRRRRDIELWAQEFGARRRSSLASSEIRAVRDRWLTVGSKHVYHKFVITAPTGPGHWAALAVPLSGSTVNHRPRALSNLWTVLDGSRAPNPVREVPDADETPQLPRAIPYDVIERLPAALPDRGRGERHQRRPEVSKTSSACA